MKCVCSLQAAVFLSLSERMLPAFFDSKLLPCTPNTRTQHLDRAIRAFEAGAAKESSVRARNSRTMIPRSLLQPSLSGRLNMPQKRQRRAPRVNTTPVTDQAGKTEAKTLQDLLNPEPTAEARACFAATATPALRSERFFRAPHRLTRAARAAPRTRHPS